MPTTDSTGRGLRSILLATAVAGLFGYAIQLLAPRMLTGESEYVAFSVFWSTLYLGISAMSGVQQEVSRAARPAIAEPPSSVLRDFTVCAAFVVAGISVLIAVTLGRVVMPDATVALGGALIVGFVGYLANAVLSGVLYGLRRWRPIAALIVLDVAIRAVLVIGGFSLQLSTEWLAFLIAVPFGASFGVVWLWIRRSVTGSFRLDVSLPRLAAHTSSTVTAAAASGVMITGLPMLIGVMGASDSAVAIGSVILAITLTRAPIVIPVIALQSFLIATVFQGGRVRPARLLRILAAALGVVALVALLGWLIGPPLISWISSGRFAISGMLSALIVASAGLVAAMCVTGPALIAVRKHVANVIGWSLAALLTILLLAMPVELGARVAIALTVPPLCGLLVHCVALGLQTRPS